MEGQLWESPTSRLAEDMPGETLGELDYLSWKGPLCLSTQTLELQITLLPSGDIQVPDGHSLPGLSCVSGIWVMKTRLEITKVSHYLLGKRQIPFGLPVCHAPGWEVTWAIGCVWTDQRGHYKPSLHPEGEHFWVFFFNFLQFFVYAAYNREIPWSKKSF